MSYEANFLLPLQGVLLFSLLSHWSQLHFIALLKAYSSGDLLAKAVVSCLMM